MSLHQNKRDLGHLVGLRSQGLDPRLRIDHQRGGDEPLLWIADILWGAINAAELGYSAHLEALQETIDVQRRTADSLRSWKRRAPDPVVRLGF